MESPTTQIKTKRNLNWFQRLGAFFLKLSLWNKIAIAIILLSIPGAFLGLKLLKPVYKSWRASNALKIAETAVENGDMNAASLAFRTAIRSRPGDPNVWRQVASFLDQAKSPESFTVWERVVRMRPEDTSARYSFAESAIRLGRLERASEALAALPDSEKTTERYLRVAASLAISSNDPLAAEVALQQLLSLNPDAADASWDLARVQLLHPDAATRLNARSAVAALADNDGPYALEAQRQLIRLALAERDFYTANRRAGALIEHPDSTAQDRVIHLDTEFASQSFTLPITRTQILEYAATHPSEAATIVNYLTARGATGDLESWFDQLPPDTRDNPAIQSAWFDFALRSADWERVFALLRGGKLPFAVSPELAEQAEDAFTDHRRGNPDADAKWQKALFLAESNPAATHSLSMIARAAEWQKGYTAALRNLTQAVPNRPEIWNELLRIELATRNSPGILNALSGAVRSDPDNRQLRNDWIVMNLLTEKGSPADLLELARGNYETDPKNSFFTTTYALALARSGQADEALPIVENLSEADRQRPDKALYYGTVLALAGKLDAAKAALDIAATKESNFLPEERAMFQQSRALASGQISSKEQIQQLMSRKEMSDEELAEFSSTVQAQITERAADNDAEDIVNSLRSAAEQNQRSPEEIQRILETVRPSTAPTDQP